MPKIDFLATKYGMSAEDVIKELLQNGFDSLTPDAEIESLTDYLLYDRALHNATKGTIHSSSATKYLEKMDWKLRKTLSRDYVIFTYMGLRKPITSKILIQILDLKINQNTSTQIVLTSIAQDMVYKTAKTNDAMVEISKNLTTLEENGYLTILPCKTISDEFSAISDFICERENSESILVIGINRPLHAFIEYRNNENKDNSAYTLIFEKDVTSQGHLANPQNQAQVFKAPERKQVAPFDEKAPLLPAEEIPTVGSSVYYTVYDKFTKTSTRIDITLGSILYKNGGEALIFGIDDPSKCVKIFREASLTQMKMEKVKVMSRCFGLLCRVDAALMDRIAWPQSVVYNQNDVPVGYIMRRFDNTDPLLEFTTHTFGSIIPGVTKTHQVTMAVSLCEIMEFCHFNNIILCDINKGNVLYDKNLTAYLVDLDSAQIADDSYCYPSNVGVPEFLPPERIGCRDFSYIRSIEDDTWILQTLLFYILTPCGLPYSFVDHSKVDDILMQPIRDGLYPFRSSTQPSLDFILKRHGQWDMIVSHLHGKTLDAFWNGFNVKGESFARERRKDALFWLNTMVDYRRSLPVMTKNDPESNKYIPTTTSNAFSVRVDNNDSTQSLPKVDKPSSTSQGIKTISWDS